MLRQAASFFAAGLLILGSATAFAQPAAAPRDAGAPVTVIRSQQYDFTSKINGRAYRIFIAKPLIPPPATGYPVVYVFDANAYFATTVEASRGLSFGPEARAAVIVGIGYPTDNLGATLSLRMKDMTTPITPEAFAATRPGPGESAANTGGLDAYLQVIEQEVKPLVARQMRIDPTDQTLFGHSLGGLAVLRALFTEPTAFRTFAASSPSIWWNSRAILGDEPAFVARVERLEVEPRIFIDVGGLEQTSLAAAPGMTLAESQAAAEKFRMVGNAQELGARLAAVKGGPHYQVSTHVFPDETHMSVIPAATSRALRFALDPKVR